MKIAYFDCIAGASGDMILGALVDAGLPLEALRAQLSLLNLGDEFELHARKVSKNGFGATKVDVLLHDCHEHHDHHKRHDHHQSHDHHDHHESHEHDEHQEQHEHEEHHHSRHLAEIEAILRESKLPERIKEKAAGMFRRLAEAEAGIHGAKVEQVHLHEVGGVDTIVDVVGALVGLEALGVEQVYGSPLPLGRGFVEGAHGQIPLPAPAAIALLKGIPVRGSDVDAELVTPTGAVLLSTLCAAFGPIPAMTLTGLGYGAGGRDLPIPNVLRLLIGEQGAGTESLVLLETNVDDNSAEVNGYVMEKLFAAGALDVFFTPIQMKKNRPATLFSVLCYPTDVDPLEAILFRETSTLGVRSQLVERHCLERKSEIVETSYGQIRVKVARLPDGMTKRAPEYDDCKRAAEAHGVPLRVVYEAALTQSA